MAEGREMANKNSLLADTVNLSKVLCLTVALAGCSNVISSSGPTRGAVMHADNSAESGIRIIDVNESVTRQILASTSHNLFSETLGDGALTGAMVGIGDVLEVSIWEAPPAALFGDAGSKLGSSDPVSKATNLPSQRVGETGQIIVPFAGTISASGRTTDQIAAAIVKRLQGKAHQPQVIVRISQNATSTVTVVGEVGGSQRMPISDRGERLLDALAAAGGVRQPVNKITIQITRGDRVRSMPLDQIIADPRQNIRLQTNDVVTALFQPYSFTTLGASGRNEELPLEASGITLSQALGRIGGLQDQRADPKGVFIFRFEDPKVLGITSTTGTIVNADGKIPVIYRVNLKNPETFFVAQSFPMHNKDIVYSSNAPLADFQKFLGIVSSIVLPIASAQTVVQR